MKLSGKVTCDGSAATNATVEVLNKTGDIVDQVQVGDDGSFTYHLAEGTWTLNAYDPHGHRGRVEVELDGDKTVSVDLG